MSRFQPYALSKMWTTTSYLVPVFWLLGQVVKDRFLPLNFCFYLPAVVGLLFSVVAYVLARKAGSPSRWVFLIIACLAGGKIFFWEVRDRSPKQPEGERTLQLLHWNTSRGRFGPGPIVAVMNRFRSDLFLFSEAPDDLDILEIVETALPNGYWFRADGMALLSRFPLRVRERIELDNGQSWVVEVQAPGEIWDLMAVDLRANLFVSRKPDMEILSDWIENESGGRPLLVVGDFNLPRDSLTFARFRKHLDHAYEEVGRGLPYSWPFPFPILQIDHIWYNSGISPKVHDYPFVFGSDHLPEIFFFELRSR